MYSELGLVVTSETATATLELLTTTMLKRTLKKHSRNVHIFRLNQKKNSESSRCRKFRQKFYLLFVEAESVISGEALVTNIAFVWFHAGVQFDVLFQIVISEKMVNFVNGPY